MINFLVFNLKNWEKREKKNFLMVKKIMASFAIYLLEIIKYLKESCQLLLPL